jgi:hypothetical protein
LLQGRRRPLRVRALLQNIAWKAGSHGPDHIIT